MGPVWRHDRFDGEAAGFAEASTRLLRGLIASENGPRLVGASDEEIEAVRIRRSALRAMVSLSLSGPTQIP
jgi:hypothetical protein